jgi:catechol 2,3-dioxygenase-like lactoylglutathione lyase family enzyme
MTAERRLKASVSFAASSYSGRGADPAVADPLWHSRLRPCIMQSTIRDPPFGYARDGGHMTSARPVLDQINIVVADMDASVAFYRHLGLEFPDVDAEWRDWEPHHRSVSTPDGVRLDFDSIAFARQWDEGWPGGPEMNPGSDTMERGRPRPLHGSGVVIGFRLDSREDVDALYEEMRAAGYRAQQPPYDAFWGARYAIIEDPDGNPVGLMSEVDPERRIPPRLPA